MPVFHTKTIESILEPVASQVTLIHSQVYHVLTDSLTSCDINRREFR